MDRAFVKRCAVVCVLAAVAAIFVMRFDGVLAVCGVVVDVISPFAVGLALAYLLNIVMAKWERVVFAKTEKLLLKKLRRPACLLLTLATVAALCGIFVVLLSNDFEIITDTVKRGAFAAIQVVSSYTSDDLAALLGNLPISIDVEQWKTAALKAVESANTGDLLQSIADFGSNLAHGVFDVVVAIVFALYILVDKERFLRGVSFVAQLVLPELWYKRACHAADVANNSFNRFVVGQCLEACILGVLCTAGMALLQMPYASSIGLCVGMTSVIPFIGAWIGGIFGALMIASVSIQQALLFVVFLIVLQQIEGHLIYPNVVGNSVGMPGIWTFVAVVVGAALFGLLGVLLGVPVVSTVRQLVLEWKAGFDERQAAAVAGADAAAAVAGADTGAVAAAVDAADALEAATTDNPASTQTPSPNNNEGPSE